MLGILSVLTLGMTEKFSILTLTRTGRFQEVKIIFNYTIAALVFLAVSFAAYDKFDFSFLDSWEFYASLTLENLGFYYMLKNYNKQKNFAQVAFAAFSSIYLIIAIGYLYPILLGTQMKVASPYHSPMEVAFFTSLFFLLTVGYFYDKLKNNDVRHPWDLIKYAFFLVNTLYFAILMFQTYQTYLVYVFIFSTLVIQQLIHLQRKGELKTLSKDFKELADSEKAREIKSAVGYSFLYILTFVLSVISGTLISVEFFAIFKRTGSIATSYIIDSKILKKETRISIKDKLILATIMSIGLWLFYR